MGKRDTGKNKAKTNPYLKQAKAPSQGRKSATTVDPSSIPTVKHEYFYEDESGYNKEKSPPRVAKHQAKSEGQDRDGSQEEEYVPSLKRLESHSSSYPIEIYDSEPILSSQTYIPVHEIDFRIFLDSINRSKVYSVMLVDKWGRVIFSDKLGHQLFEGSLNNFNNLKIQNLLLQTIKESTLSELRNTKVFTRKSIFNWIIYSKNTKRRYCRVPFSNSNNIFDTFFRFLKVLSIRFRPVRMIFDNYRTIEGFWNNALADSVGECFLLQVKLCNKLPSISPQDLWKDRILTKYIKINSIKAQLWAQCEPRTEGPILDKQSDSSSNSSLSFLDRKKPRASRKKRLQFAKEAVKHEQQKCNQKLSSGVKLFTEIFLEDV